MLRRKLYQFCSKVSSTYPVYINHLKGNQLQIFLDSNAVMSDLASKINDHYKDNFHVKFYNIYKENYDSNVSVTKILRDHGLFADIGKEQVSISIGNEEDFFSLNSPIDKKLKETRVPVQDALAISAVSKAIYSKLKSSSSSLTQSTIESVILKCVPDTVSKIGELRENIKLSLESISQDLNQLKAYKRNGEEVAQKAADLRLKGIIGIVSAQWGVLFYICYYLYGWDFTEPLGYLIALGIETVCAYYMLRKDIDLTQSHFFKNFYNKIYPTSTYNLYQIHPDLLIPHLERRIIFLEGLLESSKSEIFEYTG